MRAGRIRDAVRGKRLWVNGGGGGGGGCNGRGLRSNTSLHKHRYNVPTAVRNRGKGKVACFDNDQLYRKPISYLRKLEDTCEASNQPALSLLI